ncbi:sensor histidine kinase [Hahella ganghwensis]|uniref:sensor histidine kinase n=1 Tax=Hahella ganghwensis TaxID=286420 RepID=UPI000382EC4D|nr:HAMP domain-containing sensor histidine kinase [Hahella ganghwensis]
MLSRLPLYHRMTLLFTGIALVAISGFMVLAIWSSDRYHLEVTQRLHADLANYILEHLPEPVFTPESSVNKTVLNSIAHSTMMINPSVEVYLLSTEGDVLGHALPDREIATKRIDMKPVQRYLTHSGELPVEGSNPRKVTESSIFSVAPVMINDRLKGYLYVVLASQEANTMASRILDGHIFRVTLAALSALLVLTGLSCLISFRQVTRPLRRLTKLVRQYRLSHLDGSSPDKKITRDELVELEHSFALMRERIQQQFEHLKRADQLRRELVSNVSHDLRTPLATMQGYLETLTLKFDHLNADKRRQYLQVAYRHTRNMTRLVSQLFELSKLEAGRVEPRMEVFSMAELLSDIRQDFELIAQRKNIALTLETSDQDGCVQADIELIQRVLQNLLDNALRHTPRGGRIALGIEQREKVVEVRLTDSGQGIPVSEIPLVFERFYQSESGQYQGRQGGAGLGLSIVRRILELHGSSIRVHSIESQGACFVSVRLSQVDRTAPVVRQ